MIRASRLGMAGLLLLVVMTGQVQASLVTYSNRTAFDAAHPGLAVEDFQDISDISDALDGTNITPGVSFSLTIGTDAYLAGPGQSSNSTTAIGVNTPRAAGWLLTFSTPVDAVAFDVFQNDGGGSQFGVPIDAIVEVYGSSGLLGSFLTTIPSGSAGFVGVFSTTDLITSLSVNNFDSFDVIDDVEFGIGGTSTVPEPTSAALLGIGACLAGIGAARRRRAAKK